MTSQTGQQITTLHILPNISRSKDNQTIKFDQSIEYKMRNTFLEKSNIKFGGKPHPRPFYRKSKLMIFLDQHSLKFYQVCFYCMFKSMSTKIH